MSIATEIERLQNAKANIKTAIESKGVTVGDGTIDTYAEKIGEISGGNNPLEYANRLIQTYYDVIFPENYELTINVPYIERIDSLFGGSTTQGNLKRIIIKGNVNNNALNLNRMVYGAHSNTLEEIDFSELNLNISNLSRVFYASRGLKRILGEFDLTNCTDVTGAFSLCTDLEEVRFKKESIFISIALESSSLLSAESVQSIIDGLAYVAEYYLVGDNEIAAGVYEYPETETLVTDITNVDVEDNRQMSDGQPIYCVSFDGIWSYCYRKATNPQTLTLHADVIAKLTEQQLADIEAKGWTVA